MGFFLPHRSRRVFSIFKIFKLFPFSDFFEASSRKKRKKRGKIVSLGQEWRFSASEPRAACGWFGSLHSALVARSCAFLSQPSAVSFGLAASGTGHAGTQFVQQFHSRFSVASQVCAGLPEQYSDADRFPGQYPAAVRLSGAIPRRKGTSAGAIPPAHMLVLLAVWWQYHQFSCRMCGSSGAMPR